YVRNLRLSLNRDFPGITFYFLPADIVTETINFGLPSPFDIQVVGRNQAADQQVANAIAQKVRGVRGAVDVRVQQPNDLHRVMFSVDRTKAMQLGLSERDVAGSVLLALSGSSQVTPTYWLDPATGVQYLVNVRVPEPQTTTLSDLKSTPITASKPGTGNGQLLENVADVSRTTSQPIYSHYNVMPVVDVYGGVEARDLGGVLADIKPIIADAQKTAFEAGTGRLRPVIMTAAAMVIGMLPMALGLGEGGEQNAPLGRAVIGGLILATVATLLFVPVVFSLLHRQAVVAAKAEPKENLPSTGLVEAIPAT